MPPIPPVLITDVPVAADTLEAPAIRVSLDLDNDFNSFTSFFQVKLCAEFIEKVRGLK